MSDISYGSHASAKEAIYDILETVYQEIQANKQLGSDTSSPTGVQPTCPTPDSPSTPSTGIIELSPNASYACHISDTGKLIVQNLVVPIPSTSNLSKAQDTVGAVLGTGT